MLCAHQGVVQLVLCLGSLAGLQVLSTYSHRGPSKNAVPDNKHQCKVAQLESVAPAWMASPEHAPHLTRGQQQVQLLD